jgi:probable O-glycosylation ligase (exosortase A-associated)
MGDASAAATSTRLPNSGAGSSWIPVLALSLWLAIEIGRPPYPLRLPLICSLILVGSWLATPRKRWDPTIVCSAGLLLTAWLGVPAATNQYSAFWASYGFTIAIICISVPSAHLLNNVRHFRLFVGVFLAATAYVGVFAITHSGFGPAGSSGGQDENYVSAAMSAALPLAYFGVSATRKLIVRVMLIGVSLTCILATVVGFSRGGFMGTAFAFLFCFWHTPRKLIAILSAVFGLLVVASVAPDSYWKEIQTIGDTRESTADMRIELWTIATRQFLGNPIIGVGPGNFIWNIHEYQSAEQTAKFGRDLGGSVVVHSTYFEILSELGGVGMGLFLGMLYFTFRELRRIVAACDKTLERLRGRIDPDLKWARAFALGIQGGLIGYLVCSAFVSTTYYSTIWLMCGVAVSLRYVVQDILRAETRSASAQKQVGPKSGSIKEGFPTEPLPKQPSPRLSDLLGEHP